MDVMVKYMVKYPVSYCFHNSFPMPANACQCLRESTLSCFVALVGCSVVGCSPIRKSFTRMLVQISCFDIIFFIKLMILI